MILKRPFRSNLELPTKFFAEALSTYPFQDDVDVSTNELADLSSFKRLHRIHSFSVATEILRSSMRKFVSRRRGTLDFFLQQLELQAFSGC